MSRAEYYAYRRNENYRPKSIEAYKELKREIEKCPLQKSTYELREIANNISPGLGQVDVIDDMAQAAFNKSRNCST